MTAVWPNLADATPLLAAFCGRLLAWSPCSCRWLRRGEEAHHIMSDREPQQMDAGLDLAAQG